MTSPPSSQSENPGGRESADAAAQESVLRAALAADPSSVSVGRDLAVLLFRLGRAGEARTLLIKNLKAQPKAAELWYTLGVIERAGGDLDSAARCFKMALHHKPGFAEAHFGLGNLYRAAGRVEKARRSYKAALDVKPHMVEVHTNLGVLERDASQWDASEKAFAEAVKIAPESPVVQFNYGIACQALGRTPQARQALAQSLALEQNSGVAFRHATLIPPISASAAEIAETRQRVVDELTVLMNEKPSSPLGDPLRECDWTNFYLAYHGLDDRPLQTLAARYFTNRCPDLATDFVRDRQPGQKRAKIRLGFVSAYFKNHTIGALLDGVIGAINRDRFEVVVGQLGPGDDLTAAFKTQADQFIALPYDLPAARQLCADAALDVLVFPEIGMDPATYFLAYARLAPIQMVGWGHPVTTGISNLDYFLSADGFDHPEAEQDYSERLIRLPRLLLNYRFPGLDPDPTDRGKLGFPEERTVYYCPQSLFKLHPVMDRAFATILDQDPAGVICLLKGHRSHWNHLFLERFRRAHGDLAGRIRFIENLSRDDFIRAFAHADVILDTPHFSGGKTSLEAFAMAAPVVTWPGRYLRGRLTYGFYRDMGLDEGIASDIDDFARRAVAFGRDPERRRAFSQDIANQRGCLFEDTGSVWAFEAELLSLIETQ